MVELLYGIDTSWIAGILFASLVLSIETGYRIGLQRQRSTHEASKAQISSTQASVLGILALLLGFTFSLSLQRFDHRSEAVVEEANAIGTAYLRAQLLPASIRSEVQASLRMYLDLRVRAGHVSLADREHREALLARAIDAQRQLWEYARQAAEVDPNPVNTGLFVQALNELIDDFGKRNAALERHVPELVLWLLYGTFVMTGAIVGLSSGVAGHRPAAVTYIMVALIVVLVFIILDLDRPRRGLIEVSQQSLVDLQSAIGAGADLGAPLGSEALEAR